MGSQQQEQEQDLDVQQSLYARAAHLFVEPSTRELLAEIFSGDGDRMKLDDKRLRATSQWVLLANSFFNHSEWNLECGQACPDSRCSGIDPCLPPTKPWSSEELRTAINFVKTKYTLVYTKFHQSGQLEGGGAESSNDQIDSDDDFYEHFAKLWVPMCAKMLLYVHRLYGRQPPSIGTRLLVDGAALEICDEEYFGQTSTAPFPLPNASIQMLCNLQQTAITVEM